MDAIFTTQTEYTLEEYIKFNNVMLRKRLKLLWILIAVLVLFAVIFNLAKYNSSNYDEYKMFIANAFSGSTIAITTFVIALSFFSPVLSKIQIGIKYHSNQFIQKNCLISFLFYDNYFEVLTNDSQSKIEYSMLYKVIETKTRFYIMLGREQAHFILKDNCSSQLIEFLEELKNNKLSN